MSTDHIISALTIQDFKNRFNLDFKRLNLLFNVYPAYSELTEYNINQEVYSTQTYDVYKSLQNSNINNPLTDNTFWEANLDIDLVNEYILDEDITYGLIQAKKGFPQSMLYLSDELKKEIALTLVAFYVIKNTNIRNAEQLTLRSAHSVDGVSELFAIADWMLKGNNIYYSSNKYGIQYLQFLRQYGLQWIPRVTSSKTF